MSTFTKTVDYFSADFPRQLFPLNTNRILIEKAADALGEFVYQVIAPV